MKLSTVEGDLEKVFEDFKIIDAHEHLPPEKIYVARKVDVMTLFSHYLHYELITAGMSTENYERIQNHDMPPETSETSL